MNTPIFWAAVVAFYAVVGLLVSLAEGKVGIAGLFGLALIVCLTVIAETWPSAETFSGEETDQ